MILNFDFYVDVIGPLKHIGLQIMTTLIEIYSKYAV